MKLSVIVHVLALMVYGTVALTTLSNVQQALLDVEDAFVDVTSIIPRTDTSTPLEVTVSLNMVTLIKMDDVNGYLEISGYLTLTWKQQAYTTTTPDISFLVPLTKIWRPSLMLVNAVDGVTEIGVLSKYLRYTISTQQCEWKPWVVVKGACSTDVTYYPFDKQNCSFKISIWGQTTSEVILKAASSTWSQEFYTEHGEWEVESTSVSILVSTGDASIVELSIILERNSLYYMINLVAPVLLLAVLNSFVFILPADSGERIGFSVTCFLSYVILLNLIMSFLPPSSSPMSYLSYFTFVMMLLSAGMTLLTIVTLRIHHKKETDKIPRVIEFFTQILCCRCLKSSSKSKNAKRNKIQSMDVQVTAVSSVWDEFEVPDNGEADDDIDKVTWHDVASVLDTLGFVGFLVGQIFYSVSYLIPLALNLG